MLPALTPPAGTLPDRNVASTDKDQIKNWLVQERRVELGFESQRFNDLKRWGLAKSFFTSLAKISRIRIISILFHRAKSINLVVVSPKIQAINYWNYTIDWSYKMFELNFL